MARAYVRYSPIKTGQAALWKHFAWRQSSARCRARYGFTMQCDTQDLVQQYVYWHGEWAPAVTAWLRARLRPGDVFVDVGANVGYFSLLAATHMGTSGHVHAIEPSPACLSQLSQHLAMNGLSNVTVHPTAAGETAGQATLFTGPPENSGESSLVAGWTDDTRRITVPVTPLDALIPAEHLSRVRAVKIDVEGFEANAIAGAHRLIAETPDAQFAIETNADTFASIRDVFAANGYACYTLSSPVLGQPHPDRPIPWTADRLPHQMDLLFCRPELGTP